jgi:APA family basic amino acid/polyamine antiporter
MQTPDAPSDLPSPSGDGHPAEESTALKRVIGPKLLLLFVIGDILGTGI